MSKPETLPAVTQPTEIAEAPKDIVELLRYGIEKGVNVETLERLEALYHRVSERLAARRFSEALGKFQAECPPIPKTAKVKVATRDAAKSYSYNYAPLEEIDRRVKPILAKHGLAYTFDAEVGDNQVTATCTLRHEDGHSITAKFACPTALSQHMNPGHQTASARSYACRYALIQVLGLSSADPDDDAGVGSTTTITEHQAADLEALISETKAPRDKFLKYMGVEKLEQIAAYDYARAVRALKQAGSK